MATVVTPIESAIHPYRSQLGAQPGELGPVAMLDVLQTRLHASPSKWILLRELQVDTVSPQLGRAPAPLQLIGLPTADEPIVL
jgi:hypothetical protein